MAQKVTLVAEVSSNHGGNMRVADVFIETFAKAGADILKFQLTRFRRLTMDDPQREWFERAELTPDKVHHLVAKCVEHNVVPMFTVYHPDDVHEVAHLVPFVKVGAGEAHSGALAEEVLKYPWTTIYVSEGIRPVHATFRSDSRVKILGTCSHYPSPPGVVGLRFTSGHYDGWSDHAVGIEDSHLAVILGATVIERHVQVTLQARAPQPYELTAEEFTELRRRVDQDPDRFLGRWNHAQPTARTEAYLAARGHLTERFLESRRTPVPIIDETLNNG